MRMNRVLSEENEKWSQNHNEKQNEQSFKFREGDLESETESQ